MTTHVTTTISVGEENSRAWSIRYKVHAIMLHRQSKKKNSGGRVSRSFGMWVIVHGGRGGGTHASTRADRYSLLLLEYYTTRIPCTLLHEN